MHIETQKSWTATAGLLEIEMCQAIILEQDLDILNDLLFASIPHRPLLKDCLCPFLGGSFVDAKGDDGFGNDMLLILEAILMKIRSFAKNHDIHCIHDETERGAFKKMYLESRNKENASLIYETAKECLMRKKYFATYCRLANNLIGAEFMTVLLCKAPAEMVEYLILNGPDSFGALYLNKWFSSVFRGNIIWQILFSRSLEWVCEMAAELSPDQAQDMISQLQMLTENDLDNYAAMYYQALGTGECPAGTSSTLSGRSQYQA